MAKKKPEKIEAKNWGVGSVIKQNRVLTVPPNQREYSWRDEEVLDLLQDFQGAVDRGDPYFLGTIVLTDSEGGPPEISDGQQRLATVVVLMAAIRDYYLTHDAKRAAESIETDFLFEYDRTQQDDVPKVRLNVDDREFFRRRVLSRPDSQDRKIESPKPSHRRLAGAAERAAEFIENAVSGQKQSVAMARLNALVDFVELYAQVVVLTAPSYFSAFVMFEAMNDRGLKASQIDILKNYLFQLADSRIDEAQQRWAKMMSKIESKDDPELPLTFVRYMLILQTGPTKEKEIMERVRANVASKQKAIEFIESMLDHASDYIAVLTPDDQKWNDYGNVTRKHLATIIDDLKVEQIMPLVFAVASRFSKKETQRTFRLFVNWSVRFLVSGGRGGLLDKHYSEKAHLVGIGKIKTASELTAALIDILPPNGAFQAEFSTATVTRAYPARYYLRALELQIKGDPEPELVPNASSEVVNLEHILPENPSDDWLIEDEVAVGLYRRLGNLVLLQATPNSTIGNSSFQEKKKVYKGSAFLLTSMVAKERSWGTAEINKRQQKLAELAVETWPLTLD